MKSMKEAIGYRGLMIACFSMAGLLGLSGMLTMFVDPSWETAATGTGMTGFWFALGLFFEAEQSRERAEAKDWCRFETIITELKKRDCACQTDPPSE